MTVAIRVIPCLDVDAGRVVKGTKFRDLRDVADPVELASAYVAQGADELTFLDISASLEGRATMLEVVRATAAVVPIPLSVGGGIRTVEDAAAILEAGADKVGVNTAAIANPQLIDEIAARFGSQALVAAVDAGRDETMDSGFGVITHGGRRQAGLDAVAWSREVAERGAGQILLTSLDADGMKTGFDLEMIQAVHAGVELPVIASGGAGQLSDFVEAVEAGAEAVLAASVFHFGVVTVAEVKAALRGAGYAVL